jgi:nucleoside-triphosphatase THEP1
MDRNVNIKITGKQGSGKTRTIEILHAALEKNGYNITHLHPIPRTEERLMAWNTFHTINIEVTNNKEEVKDV